jgi:hypothetical protein
MQMQLDRATVPATILYKDKVTSISHTMTKGDDLWVTLPDLTLSTGWELKPEGICQDGVCILIPRGRSSAFVQEKGEESWFNLSEFARLQEQPCAHDDTHKVWSFGAPTEAWGSQLGPRMAPDFTLPDLDGNLHTLSDFRGKKVFLVCWASW